MSALRVETASTGHFNMVAAAESNTVGMRGSFLFTTLDIFCPVLFPNGACAAGDGVIESDHNL